MRWLIVGMTLFVASCSQVDIKSSGDCPNPISAASDSTIHFAGSKICTIDGDGTHTIIGNGQDLLIVQKNGAGSATLQGFHNITIGQKKDGDGKLIVENCSSADAKFSVPEINGNGDTYLNCAGPKRIEKKDGKGNIYYKGQQPTFGQINDGKVLKQ